VKRDQLRGALEAVDRVLNRGGEADDVLRAVVATLHDRVPHYGWAGISFVERGRLELGPESGSRAVEEELATPIAYEGRTVGQLHVRCADAEPEDRAFLERVATLVSPYCLVGWDTGGRRWEP
jgi:putative methionine-R-sulfoxide reductase with GAF domain